MKIYLYDSLIKTNQALGSFKEGSIEIHDIHILQNKDEVHFYVVTNPLHAPRPKKVEEEKKVVEKKVAKKASPKKNSKKTVKKDKDK